MVAENRLSSLQVILGWEKLAVKHEIWLPTMAYVSMTLRTPSSRAAKYSICDVLRLLCYGDFLLRISIMSKNGR